MKLLDGTHCFVIIGDKGFFEIIRSATAMTETCDRIARLRIQHTDQRYKIMAPRFCEHGCCILGERLAYTLGSIRYNYSKCVRKKRGVSLV